MLKKKIFILSLLGIFLPISTVYAEVNQTQKLYEETKAECKVYYSSTTDFSVLIPKKITLGSSKTSSYTVTVTGDIASDTSIIVKPDTTFKMKDISGSSNPKEDVVATITQDSISWNWEEASNKVEKVGKVSAPKLSAGNWEGNFNFTIILEEDN